MKKKGFQVDKHKEVGRELYEMHKYLIELSSLVGMEYGVKAPAKIYSLIDSLYEVRQQLENEMYKENPEMDTQKKHFTYNCGAEDQAKKYGLLEE